MYCTHYASPVGRLLLTCRNDGLTGIWFGRELPDQHMQEEHPILLQTRQWLDAYFQGEKPSLGIPLLPEGTVFQKQVWNLLLDIPYGETCSYGDLTRKLKDILGKENMSAQAVGQAVGKNPISILVPCHRVVGTKGQLTGYGGGMERKIWLLSHEGHPIENNIVL